MSFDARRVACAAAVDACLSGALAGWDDVPVVAAMRHALSGGKRLRGFFVMETATLFDVPGDVSVHAAAAIEAVHAYSLVHDDLPCMDDDALRRGQPTVHVKWDEATAVLTGDALQSLAFELLARPELGSAEIRVTLSGSLAAAAGGRGMVLGQAQDIAAERAPVPLTLEQITALQAKKTGALFGWSCAAGAVLAGEDPYPLRRYAQAVGLAFQIVDDILDVVGDADAVGKSLRKDARAGKATFVSLMGLDEARARATSLVEEACTALERYGAKADCLREAARFVIDRRN